MSLPKLQAMVYTIDLPKTGKINYRPITVKEEGIILTAIEMGENADQIETLKTVVQSCILTENINVNDLLVYEFVYLLLLLRTKSKGAIITTKPQKCEHCAETLNISVNLEEVQIFENVDQLEKLVKVNESLSLGFHALKADSMHILFNYEMSNTKFTDNLYLLANMIDKVVLNKKVYTEFTKDELVENILAELPTTSFEDLTDELKKLISFNIKIYEKCGSCEKDNTYEFKDPLSFLF